MNLLRAIVAFPAAIGVDIYLQTTWGFPPSWWWMPDLRGKL